MKKKQFWLILLCWSVYTLAYTGRYSYNSNINLIMSDFSVGEGSAGFVSSCFFFAYGAGQIFNGLFCRRYNKKYVLFGALCVSALVNLILYFGVSFSVIKYLWFVNGAVQSTLWSSLILTLTENIEKKNLGKAILAMSTTTSIGTLLAYGGSALFVHFGKYRLSFLMGAGLLAFAAACWLFSYSALTGEIVKEENGSEEKTIEKSGKSGFASILPFFCVFALFAVADNIVKDGLHTWIPVILKNKFSMGDSASILLTLVLPVFGIFGAVAATSLNKLFKDFTKVCGVFFFISAVFIAIAYAFFDGGLWFVVLFSLAIAVFAMHGTNNVITSIAPMYMREKVNSGMLAGLLNGFCYVGSTISAYGLGMLAQNGGWTSVIRLFLVLCSVCTAISVVYIIVKNKGRDKK